jgi:hypothetical protein
VLHVAAASVPMIALLNEQLDYLRETPEERKQRKSGVKEARVRVSPFFSLWL